MKSLHILMFSICTVIAFAVTGTEETATGGEGVALSADSCLLQYEAVYSGCISAISKVRTMKHITPVRVQSCYEWVIAKWHTVYVLKNYRNNVPVKPFSLFCTYKE